LSRLIRDIEFTELVKRRMVEELKDQVEQVRGCSAKPTVSRPRSSSGAGSCG